ncbi:MAG: hypothetical protein QW076_01050 [Candidatus Anstonellales archaeon]
MLRKPINNDPINTLHKYYIWANRMRTHFDELLDQDIKRRINDQKRFLIETDMYMSLWYGLLYVVIEGWQELELKDTMVDSLIKNKNTDLLKNYRHGVFHFHKIDSDIKFEKFFQEETTVEWIRTLNREFGRWFLNYYKQEKYAEA